MRKNGLNRMKISENEASNRPFEKDSIRCVLQLSAKRACS